MASSTMIKFLEGVDHPAVENTVKDVANALVAVQVYESQELYGLSLITSSRSCEIWKHQSGLHVELMVC